MTFKGLLSLAAVCVLLATPALAFGPNGEVDGLEAKFIDINGVSTRYYDYGQGEPILMLHGGVGFGGSSTANNWSRNIPVLAERFHVVAIDRLGSGMTEGPVKDEDFSHPGSIAHVRDVIETLGLGPVHLVGHSSGGALAFYFAMENPDLVKTLTVVSFGPGMPPAGEGRTKFDALLDECPPDRESYEHRLCRLLALGNTPTTFPEDYAAADEWMGNQPRAVKVRARIAAMRARGENPGAYPDYNEHMWQRARAGELKMPILIFAGKEDTIGWDAGDDHSMLRGELGFFNIVGTKNINVQMMIVNNAGHFPYREQPEMFNAGLAGFIDFWASHVGLNPRER